MWLGGRVGPEEVGQYINSAFGFRFIVLGSAVEIGLTNLGRASKGDRSPCWVSQLDGDCVDQNSRARYSLQLPGDTLHLDKR